MKPAYNKRPVDSPPPSTSQKSPKRRNLVQHFQKEETKQISIKKELDDYTNDNSSLAQNNVMDNAESSSENSTIFPNFIIDETELKKIDEEIAELKTVLHEKTNTIENMKKTYEEQHMDRFAEHVELRMTYELKKNGGENYQNELSHFLQAYEEKLRQDQNRLASLNEDMNKLTIEYEEINKLTRDLRDYEREVKEWEDGVDCKKHETDPKRYWDTKLNKQHYSKNSEQIEILCQKISHAEERMAELNGEIPKLQAVKNALEAELRRVENFGIYLGDKHQSDVNIMIKRIEEEFGY